MSQRNQIVEVCWWEIIKLEFILAVHYNNKVLRIFGMTVCLHISYQKFQQVLLSCKSIRSRNCFHLLLCLRVVLIHLTMLCSLLKHVNCHQASKLFGFSGASLEGKKNVVAARWMIWARQRMWWYCSVQFIPAAWNDVSIASIQLFMLLALSEMTKPMCSDVLNLSIVAKIRSARLAFVWNSGILVKLRRWILSLYCSLIT